VLGRDSGYLELCIAASVKTSSMASIASSLQLVVQAALRLASWPALQADVLMIDWEVIRDV
jgi:hypothetical protein